MAALSPKAYASTLTEYSIGNPTAEEQYYVELINRTRADPAGEGVRLSGSNDPDLISAFEIRSVDLAMFRSEMAALSSAPPVAPNGMLSAAARLHSLDQLANAFQGHTGSNGSNAGDRITAQGYTWSRWSENVYAYSKSPFHGHAAFVVDWGTGGTGGMQDPRAHRESIMQPEVRELGVGNMIDSNGGVGPEVVTQVFATGAGSGAFITGVVYYDTNQNTYYDVGEGVGGVLVTSPASANFAITADAGGYALPVTENGVTSVSFEYEGTPLETTAVEISDLGNRKVDRAMPYVGPVLSGASTAAIGVDNVYTFSPVVGANEYDVRVARIDSSSWSEGAEDGTTEAILDGTSSRYSLRSGTYANSGLRSFWLTFPDWEDQSFEIERDLVVSKSSALQFDLRFGWVTAASRLYAEITADGGQSWTVVYERAGADNSGDASFVPQSISLEDFAGETVGIRFRFRHHNRAYIGTSTQLGVYVDNITVASSTQLVDTQITVVPGSSTGFTITPDGPGEYRADVRPRTPAAMPYGDSLTIAARFLPRLKVSDLSMADSNTVAIDFRVEDGSLSGLALETTTSPGGPWTTVQGATLTDLGSGKFRFKAAAPRDKAQFYRLTGSTE